MPDAMPPDSFDPPFAAVDERSGARRLAEAAFAAVLLVVLAPTLVVLWGLVCLDGGPGLVGERRIGLRGRSFNCLTLRTGSAGPRQGPVSVSAACGVSRLDDAARLTTVGRFLRAANLDALPQLLHVVTGDMTLFVVCRR